MSWSEGIYIYSQEYKTFLLSQIESISQSSDNLTPESFSHIDSFHPGGHTYLSIFLDKYSINSHSRVFEPGSGIGGTTRYMQKKTGCFVHSMDYLEHFVEIADIINAHTKQQDHIYNRQGDINTYPIEENSFDASVAIAMFLIVGGNQGFLTISKGLKSNGLFYFEDYYFTKEREEMTPEEEEIIEEFCLFEVRSRSRLLADMNSANLELVEFNDIGHHWSEFAWNRSEKILNKNLNKVEENNPEQARELRLYGKLGPRMLRSMKHLSNEEIAEKFPLTLEEIGGYQLLQTDEFVSAASIVASKV